MKVYRKHGNTKKALLNHIKKRKPRYFGHVKWSNTVSTMVLEGSIGGKRPRGRQRNTWITDVKEWTSLSARTCTCQAAHRSLWNAIARLPLQRRWHYQVINPWGSFFHHECRHDSAPSKLVRGLCRVETPLRQCLFWLNLNEHFSVVSAFL